MRLLLAINILLFSFVMASCALRNSVSVAPPPDVKKLNKGVEWRIKRVEKPKMLYPRKEFVDGREGWVLIRCNINEFGRPEKLKVVDFSPGRGFIDNALRYIEDSIFYPYEVEGKPVQLNGYYFLVKFHLNKDSS